MAELVQDQFDAGVGLAQAVIVHNSLH